MKKPEAPGQLVKLLVHQAWANKIKREPNTQT